MHTGTWERHTRSDRRYKHTLIKLTYTPEHVTVGEDFGVPACTETKQRTNAHTHAYTCTNAHTQKLLHILQTLTKALVEGFGVLVCTNSKVESSGAAALREIDVHTHAYTCTNFKRYDKRHNWNSAVGIQPHV